MRVACALAPRLGLNAVAALPKTHAWQVAMQDPRIMAELNHAMGIATVQDVRRYY